MFAVHTLVAEDNAMDAEKAFVTLTVLSILNKAQAFLPFSVHCIVQVRCEEGQGVGELGPGSAHPDHCQQRTGGKGLESRWTPSGMGQRVQGDLSKHPGELLHSGTHPGSLPREGPFISLPLSFLTHSLGPAEKED